MGNFNECWNPRIVGDLNDSYVKIVKFHGEFTWHKHNKEDELLMVIRGLTTIQFHDHNVVLNEGEFMIVPKGVEHCPKAEYTADVLLLEPQSTLNAGDDIDEKRLKILIGYKWNFQLTEPENRVVNG